MQSKLKIGELAERTGCLVETIRFYERKSLLPAPTRSEGNYRLYNDGHIERLRFIRHCRSLDMTLDEIRVLLRFTDAPDENCGEVNLLLDKHISHVADRIKELKRLAHQLQDLRKTCLKSQAAKDCGILQGLANVKDGPPKNLGTHGGGCH
ncbi:MAG: cadR [Herbaspirillum sp.]|jgi:Cd(II)/Pb(II)-responsive transcriptional regulator|nr:cadR [Herbaspirillum sp.]